MRFIPSCRAARLATLALLFGCDGHQLVEPSEFSGEPMAAAGAKLPVAAPSNLTATAVSATRIDLTWTDNSSNESGFELYRSTGGATGTFVLLANPAANATAYTEWFAQPLTQYCFKVRAVSRTGMKSTYSGFSIPACATTPELPPPPAPPPPEAAYGLDVAPFSSTSVAMTWNGSGTDGYAFKIERSMDGGTTWSSVGTESGTGFFHDPGLTSDQQVCYRVIAYNTHGEASPSNTDCTAPPTAPTGLVGTLREDGAVQLSWSDNSAVEDGYEVWVQISVPNSDCDAGCYTEIYDWLVGDLPANSTSYGCYNECGWPTYVKAKKDGGTSDMSNVFALP